MLGFSIPQSTDVIYFAIRDYYAQARERIIEELTSPGYVDIIDNVYISSDFQEIQISLKDGFKVDNQDIFEVLARGGTILKVGTNGTTEPVAIKPSSVIRKYLGKR